jgi:hypothetical protein
MSRGVVAHDWDDGLRAFVSADGMRLDWANDRIWVWLRNTKCGR